MLTVYKKKKNPPTPFFKGGYRFFSQFFKVGICFFSPFFKGGLRGFFFLLLFSLSYINTSASGPPPACDFKNTTGLSGILNYFYFNNHAIYYESGFMGVEYVDATGKTEIYANGKSAILTPGATYVFDTLYGGNGGVLFYYYYIFIDFDGDGNFTTPGDTVARVKTKVFRENTGNIKIPVNAKFGPHRMRITVGDSLTVGVTTGCGEGGQYSQAVDFSVDILRQIYLDSLVNPSSDNDSVYCAGTPIKIYFRSNVQLDSTNIFYAELSGVDGYFSTPSTVGSIKKNQKGSYFIDGILPHYAGGSDYHLRIVSSSPYFISDTSNSILINPLPTPIIEGDSIVCLPETVTYRSNLASNISYKWHVEGGTLKSGVDSDTLTILWQNAGTGKIVLVQTNNITLCSDSAVFIVNIYPKTNPVIIGNNLSCVGELFIYAADYDTVPSIYQWSVSSNGTIVGNNTDSILKVIWNTTGAASVKMIKRYASGCTDSTTLNLTVNNIKPTPEIVGLDSICEISYTNYSVDTLNSGSSFIWKISGGEISGDTNKPDVNILWNKGSTGTLTLIETNATGCRDSSIMYVKLMPLPHCEIFGDSIVCENNVTQYTANPDSELKYHWNIEGGTIISSDTADNVLVLWQSKTSGQITLTEENVYGCKDTTKKNISINSVPKPEIAGRNIACLNETVSYSTNFNSDIYYNWSVEPADIAYIDGLNTTPSVNIIFNSIGKALLKVIQTNYNTGCSDSLEMNIFVSDIIIDSLQKNDYCPGDSIDIKYHFAPEPDSVGNINILLFNVSGNPVYYFDVPYDKDHFPKIGVPDNIPLGQYRLRVLCRDYSKNILIGLPPPNIEGEQNVCKNYLASYTTPIIPDIKYKWEVSGGVIQGSDDVKDIQVLWQESGKGNIKLTINDKKGCFGFNNQPIIIYFKDLKIDGKGLICSDNLISRYSINAPGTTKTWFVEGGKILNDNKNEFIDVKWNPEKTGKVTVLLKVNSGGCTDSVSMNVNIDTTTLPKISISGDSAVCENTNHFYRIKSTPGFRIKWQAIGGDIDGSDSSETCNIKWNSRAEAKVIASEILPSGCFAADTLFVNIASFLSNIIGRQNVCKNETSKYFTKHYDKITNKWDVIGGTIKGPDNADSVTIEWQPGSGYRVVNLNQVTSPENCEGKISLRIYLLNPILTIKLADLVSDPSKEYGTIDTISAIVIIEECLQDLVNVPDKAEFYLNLRRTLFLPKISDSVSYQDFEDNRRIKVLAKMKSVEENKVLFGVLGNILLGDVIETNITCDSSKWINSLKIKVLSGKIQLVNIPNIDGLRLLKESKVVLMAYPNPSGGNITIDAISKEPLETELKIFDQLGNIIYRKDWRLEKGKNEQNIDCMNFILSGSYYVIIEDGINSTILQFNVIK